jgi:C1A family cysteine protease
VVRESARFATFKDNARKLHSKQRHAGELMALNVFGDQSYDELAAQSCLIDYPDGMEEELPVADLEALVAAEATALPSRVDRRDTNAVTGDFTALPSRVDWRDANAVTEVKRQAPCAWCWAFATAAAVEGRQALLTNKPAISL